MKEFCESGTLYCEQLASEIALPHLKVFIEHE